MHKVKVAILPHQSSLEHKNFMKLKETQLFYLVINPIPHGGGGGGADSALLQIVFFIPSIRDAAEPRNLVTFS